VPPAVRFDYFIGRCAEKGKAFVWTLEICELGFSMLGEPDLPKKVFQAMLNNCISSSQGEALPPVVESQNVPTNGGSINKKGNASKGKGAGKEGPAYSIPDDAPKTIYIGIPQLPSMTDDQKQCHGEYQVQSLSAQGKPVWFAEMDDCERWLYHSNDGYWYVGDHEERAKNFKCDEGYLRGKGSGMPTEVKSWEYYDDKRNKWQQAKDIAVSTEEDVLEIASKPSGGQGAGKSSQRSSGKGKRR
jgi:hypothetical protein